MATLEALKQSVSGIVIARDDLPCESSRRRLPLNAPEPERFPDAIVGATSVKDVQAAVRFAHQHGLKVTARGGGRHGPGVGSQEGLLIDLSALNHVKVDPVARIAEAGPAVTNRALERALAGHGLPFPVGLCPTAPFVGYLPDGAFGRKAGAWSAGCFSVEGLDVVTADGELCRASETENADIFRAARGADPAFFGVITAYRLRLQQSPRARVTSAWTEGLDLANLRWLRDTGPAIAPMTQ